MQTKAELLHKMKALYACCVAADYVTQHESDSALEIFRSCDRTDWLCWLGGRVKPSLAAEYAQWCAGRAKSHAAYSAHAANAAYYAAAYYAADAAANAAYYADAAANAAANAAAYYAAEAANAAEAAYYAERRLQAAWWHARAEDVLCAD